MANLLILVPTTVVAILILSLLIFIFRRKLRSILICCKSVSKKDAIESADFNIELDSFLPSETSRYRIDQQCERATLTQDTYNDSKVHITTGLSSEFNQHGDLEKGFDETSAFEIVFPNSLTPENDKETPRPNAAPRCSIPPDDEDEIQILQNTLRENPHQLDAVRQVQKLWLGKNIPDSSDESTQCKLIIGVDATPNIQAGYCINLEEKSLHFYVVKRDHLPWIIHNLQDSSEFEMKNLMFALTIWNEDIIKYKRIRVYTDNFAVGWESGRYGCRAGDLIRHYENCEDVTIMNTNNIAVNKYKNLKYFAKFIQPADDLSRWKITEAVEFLKEVYGIDDGNIQGTHTQKTNGPMQYTWYNPTDLYEEVLKKVDKVISSSPCKDHRCNRILQKSLQNIPKTTDVMQQ